MNEQEARNAAIAKFHQDGYEEAFGKAPRRIFAERLGEFWDNAAAFYKDHIRAAKKEIEASFVHSNPNIKRDCINCAHSLLIVALDEQEAKTNSQEILVSSKEILNNSSVSNNSNNTSSSEIPNKSEGE